MSATTAPPAAAAVVNATLTGGLLSSVSAAEAFGTLNECGCWLLQQYLALRQVAISTMDYESEWSFSWHRQQPVGALSAQLSRPATLTREEQAPAKAQLTSSVSCCVEVASYDLTRRIPPSSPKDSRVSIASRFVIQLSQYSSQPASEVVANINSCNITMYYQALSDAGGVADLLYGLRSLKLLKVSHIHPVRMASTLQLHAFESSIGWQPHQASSYTSEIS